MLCLQKGFKECLRLLRTRWQVLEDESMAALLELAQEDEQETAQKKKKKNKKKKKKTKNKSKQPLAGKDATAPKPEPKGKESADAAQHAPTKVQETQKDHASTSGPANNSKSNIVPPAAAVSPDSDREKSGASKPSTTIAAVADVQRPAHSEHFTGSGKPALAVNDDDDDDAGEWIESRASKKSKQKLQKRNSGNVPVAPATTDGSRKGSSSSTQSRPINVEVSVDSGSAITAPRSAAPKQRVASVCHDEAATAVEPISTTTDKGSAKPTLDTRYRDSGFAIAAVARSRSAANALSTHAGATHTIALGPNSRYAVTVWPQKF